MQSLSMSEAPDLLSEQTLRQRPTYPHWVRDRVRWSDTDMAGHVNNLAFAGFCESGRALLLRRFMERDAAPRALLVLAEIRLKFLGEANWPADIDIGTAVSAIGQRSCRMVQGLFDGERCFAVSESVLVLIDESTRKSREIPDQVRHWLLGYSLQSRQMPHPEIPATDTYGRDTRK
jgi:acyl-CoA thioester hydrolase